MTRPRIGVFDSGVGGLGVWREIVRALPGVATVYWADRAHVPYGGRPVAFLDARADAAVQVLRAHGASLIVVACNTATAVSLATLRAAYPDIAFVGMEPAIKPAAASTETGVVGVLATHTTLAAPGFRALLERHADGVKVVTRAGEGMVEAVEAGETAGPRVERLVTACVSPLRDEGVDRLVLGCTHYPFLLDAIAASAGPGVTIVDPAPAVARRVAQLWSDVNRCEGAVEDDAAEPVHRLLTSADPDALADAFGALMAGAPDARFGFADHGTPPTSSSRTAVVCRQKT